MPRMNIFGESWGYCVPCRYLGCKLQKQLSQNSDVRLHENAFKNRLQASVFEVACEHWTPGDICLYIPAHAE